ncbi:M16 family metallopeptidase [uncultured Sphingomonas sp.]|uniref:M16 family metallopeptidase n=1 Tax=uncultured Sphingomonas sp. TaxID=158754 RepID=UPI0035CB0288
MTKAFALTGAALVALAAPAVAQDAKPAPVADLVKAVDIPFEQFTLPNGLRVVVHTDRKAPIVAVSVWYHIGSKDEPAGRTGFAHLFEHLMFGGSENSDQSWFQPMQAIGATGLNGTTYFDRTNYFETVPRGALDTALFLESDRMGHLLGAITQAKLDIQRGVVQNEKRGNDNQPGGLVDYKVLATLFPEGHPYHHTTIGSMADLDKASLADVKGWFRQHYGPNNAVLVLAGDIDVAAAKPLVAKYFGDIPGGPANVPTQAAVPTLPKRVDLTFKDQVAQTTVTRVWAIPGSLDPSAPALDMVASIIGGLQSSRLQQSLVRGSKVAVSVSAGSDNFERVGEFQIDAVVKPGADPVAVGAAIDATVADFIKSGPTEAELRRAKTSSIARTIRGLEGVGGFSGKAVTLASGAVYAGDPGFYKKELAETAALTPAAVQAAARTWLSRPVLAYTLEPGQRDAYEEAASVIAATPTAQPPVKAPASATGPAPTATRGAIPTPVQTADLDFPKIEHATLSNGIAVEFARRSAVPIVNVSIDFDAGAAADPKAKLGTHSLMLRVLKQGTDRYDTEQIAETQEGLGTRIDTSATMDRTNVSMAALTPNLAASLDLMADIVRHPAFRPADIDRVRGQQLAGIAGETKEPVPLALRVLPPMLYGKDSPYGVPFTGTGDAAVVATLTRADLTAFRDAWLRPDKATIFVVGDTSLAAVMPLLERSFGGWHVTGTAPTKDFTGALPAPRGRIVVIDRPGVPQSLIFAGQLLPKQGTDDLVPLDQANNVLGGSFLSRLNMDLRETKHWSYGVQGFLNVVQHTVPYLIYAPVQADQTGPSIAAMRGDIASFLGGKGVTPAELTRTVDGAVRALPGRYETAGSVLGAMEGNQIYGRPDDYQATLPARYRALTAPVLDAAAKSAIDPDRITWVVIGDAAKVKPQLDTLGLPVEVVPAAPGQGTK